MAWDPVPWLIGGDSDGGAHHSPEIMRMLSYFILGGEEGVLGKHDLRVMPLSTPGPGYRVMPGACGVVSRWQPLQEYVGRMAEETEEDAGPPTSSASGRSDLIVANVKDPFAPGSPWDPPANREFGPYIESEIITDVPPQTKTFQDLGITNWSAIPLARVDSPPSTATLQASNFVDLRVVNNPISGVEPPVEVPEAAGSKFWTEASRTLSESMLYAGDRNWKQWPTEANWMVTIPPWATGADLFVTFNPQMFGNIWGEIRLNIGGTTGVPSHFDDNYVMTPGSGPMRTQLTVSGTQPIPPHIRGRRVPIKLEALQKNLPNPIPIGDLKADSYCYVYASLNFKQSPVFV